jgi:hypothetical protein
MLPFAGQARQAVMTLFGEALRLTVSDNSD